MLDVHSPHERIHGFGDFLLHLLTITIGLLIALGLYERGLKTLALTDSALFFPHVVPFINFNEAQERVFYQDPETLSLLLARTWGLLDTKLPEIVRERANRLAASVETEDTSDDLASALEKVRPNHPLVIQWKAKKAARATPPKQSAIDRVRELLGSGAPIANAAAPRQLVEHAAILDTLRTTSVEEAAHDLTSIGDLSGASDLRSASAFALRELGIIDLKIVSDFPIALCAVGYTRITRDPNRSMLTPFETLDPGGRVPLYVVSSETEGIYFQLDPIRVVLPNSQSSSGRFQTVIPLGQRGGRLTWIAASV